MDRSSGNNSPEHPTGERWDPLGAPDENEDDMGFDKLSFCDEHHQYAVQRLQSMEDEAEVLNSSLFALTTHIAQVQFRLRQVVDSPAECREELLKSLEEFAFRGIPDVGLVKEKMDEATLTEAVRLRRTQQRELIDQLKNQLRELEQYAFDNGEAGVPQDVLLERQRVILNELKTRMNLELDEQNYYQMTPEGVKQQINLALDQLISPLKVKEHLIAQLKTQVADLERFIGYLQNDGSKKQKKCSCGCSYHSVKQPFHSETTLGLIQKTATILQMIAVMQLGCGVKSHFRKNDLKNTMKVNHWGDLRAKLEMAISRVKELAESNESYSPLPSQTNCDYTSDSEGISMSASNVKITNAVRKLLVPCIRDLMQHGSCSNQSTSLVPFIGCFARRTYSTNQIHAWQLILEYYHLKNGEKYNSTPARKLSQSFNLDIAGASPNSNKHNMLCAIGTIISTHTPYKRSYDSHFKAFICAALNANKLVPWLNLLFTCTTLIKEYYLPWSYVVKTGFQDSLKSLDVLTKYKFDLPVDLAVRHFQNIKDVFT
ncbi:RUN domain-containing protein 1 [Anthonomus grandis grandis]|uniref:RUN domain-containing protein 1 n=1 Tax=Anthonomus grandis grandis TaxID=2921223 RepID=UPI0021660E16|nr:RUN domain-containing protein 1 [Anthonomus grandis grandis]XP_050314765.1 RUN domain-containing protein 1 [Anthonomus grandis grandis]XP_050314767.1 RUN domain-containing protein 1 [Anthonomus grandis grandis]